MTLDLGDLVDVVLQQPANHELQRNRGARAAHAGAQQCHVHDPRERIESEELNVAAVGRRVRPHRLLEVPPNLGLDFGHPRRADAADLG